MVSSPLQDQRGIVSLATTVVILAAALVVAVSVQYLGIGELQMGFGAHQSEQAFEIAESCAHEALLRLRRSTSYTGATLSVGTGSCTITVTGSGVTRTITVQGTAGEVIRRIQVDVDAVGTDAMSITAWQELLT